MNVFGMLKMKNRFPSLPFYFIFYKNAYVLWLLRAIDGGHNSSRLFLMAQRKVEQY